MMIAAGDAARERPAQDAAAPAVRWADLGAGLLLTHLVFDCAHVAAGVGQLTPALHAAYKAWERALTRMPKPKGAAKKMAGLATSTDTVRTRLARRVGLVLRGARHVEEMRDTAVEDDDSR